VLLGPGQKVKERVSKALFMRERELEERENKRDISPWI
jgi:hypothetical protein